MAISFRSNAQRPNLGRPQVDSNTNASAALAIPLETPLTQAPLRFQHHIICCFTLLLVTLLYLHIGHRWDLEPAALYEPRLFWRSLAAEVWRAGTRLAVWVHNRCEEFQL